MMMMEIVENHFIKGSLRRYWRRRRYQRLDGAATGRRNMKVARLGGEKSSNNRRFWRVRVIPKLKWKIVISPMKILARLRDCYVNMMVGWAGNDSFFGNKRIPKARQSEKLSIKKAEEYETKLILEIYKALKASRELSAF